MSAAILSPIVTPPTVVPVLPAQTTVATWDVRFDDILAVQIDNLDATQDFTGTLQRRLDDTNEWAYVGPLYFGTVTPGKSIVVDCDVRTTRELRIVGYMSGAGGDVRVTAVRRAASR